MSYNLQDWNILYDSDPDDPDTDGILRDDRAIAIDLKQQYAAWCDAEY